MTGMYYVTYIACNVYFESILESDLCDLFLVLRGIFHNLTMISGLSLTDVVKS
jgi:hypothetical protein